MIKQVIFDNQFFNGLAKRWLKSYEVYVLLQSLEELFYNNIIQITKTIPPQIDELFSIYFVGDSLFDSWPFPKNGKISRFNIKIYNLDRIKCIYYSNNNTNIRVYTLIPYGKYYVIHYRKVSNIRNTANIDISFKIIDFSPNYCYENSKKDENMLIVIDSNITNFQEMVNISNNLHIAFGNKFTKCNAISANVLSCLIPHQKESIG